MRDYRKLRAFEVADDLVLAVYEASRNFPREEQFGLTSQVRRAAISVASNIVEGCARSSERDFLHFLDMAYGSAREVGYQITLAQRLGYLSNASFKALVSKSDEAAKVLNGLIRSFRKTPAPAE